MWSDDEIDSAFRRLAPPEPEPEPFPLDAWLRLESKLDKDLMERQFRLRLWKFFAGEMAVVAVVALAWLLWPSSQTHEPVAGSAAASALPSARSSSKAEATVASRQRAVSVASPAALRTPSLADAAPAPGTMAADVAPITGPAPAFGTMQGQSGRASRRLPATLPLAAASPAAMPLASAPEKEQRSTGKLSAAYPASLSRRKSGAAGAVLETKASISKGRFTTLAVAGARRRKAMPAVEVTPQGTTISPVISDKLRSSSNSTASKSAVSTASAVSSRARGHQIAVAGIATPPRRGQQLQAEAAPYSGAPARVTIAANARKGASSYLSPAAQLNTNAAGGGSQDAEIAAAAQPTAAIERISSLSASLVVAPLPAMPLLLPALPVAPPPPTPELARLPRLYVGLLAAPDVSTVKMADYQSPRANLGLLVEYRLSKRLRLGSGLLRGTKVYRARREDYTWSGYSYPNSAKFEWVDGSCTIYDVPLNLRYDLQQRPRYHLFATVGLSSLFMQREKYAYEYRYDSIPPNPYPYPGYPDPDPISKSGRWEKEYVNQNQHWFSVLNLSFGYERRLGRRWSMQAEPYVKLPLGGVGAGKVRLASGGVFLGLKYGF